MTLNVWIEELSEIINSSETEEDLEKQVSIWLESFRDYLWRISSHHGGGQYD